MNRRHADEMKIRKSLPGDMEQIKAVYERAREYMRETGNETQWGTTYPPEELIREDIVLGRSYVLTDEENSVHAVFMFAEWDDPTYRVIENGEWLNDRPYGVIHRIASDGLAKGAVAACVAFCRRKNANLRIDTHRNNRTMQHVLEKNGFSYCGIIYTESGDERLAYQSDAAKHL